MFTESQFMFTECYNHTKSNVCYNYSDIYNYSDTWLAGWPALIIACRKYQSTYILHILWFLSECDGIKSYFAHKENPKNHIN